MDRSAGYDRDDFVLFERYIAAAGGTFHGFGWPPQSLRTFGYPGPKKKYTLCCGISIAASDQPNLNRGWATASWARKQEIIADHTYFERGMFHFLSSDPQVPASVREEFQRYGLCPDEFAAFDHIPPQLYIRESNRLVGDFVLTQNNIGRPAAQPDGIATANWWLDMHMTGKYAVPAASGDGRFIVELEGNFPADPSTRPPPYDERPDDFAHAIEQPPSQCKFVLVRDSARHTPQITFHRVPRQTLLTQAQVHLLLSTSRTTVVHVLVHKGM